MAHSASSAALVPHQIQEDIAPLPLIRCPRCNIGVTAWFVSHTLKNPGRHFYKCDLHGQNGCGFWKWEDAYIDYIRARWGHMFATPQPAPIQQHNPDMLRLQADIRNILFIGIATLIGVVLLLGSNV